MSEAGFRLFSALFPVGAEIFYAVCFSIFLTPFLSEGEKKGKKSAAVFAVCLAASLFCAAAALPRWVFGPLLMALTAGLFGAFRQEKKTALWLVLLYRNAGTCAGLIMESLYFFMERLQPSEVFTPEKAYGRAALMVMIFLLSHGVLFLLMLYLFGRQIRKRSMSFSLRELCCISLIPAAGILFGRVISGLLFEFQDSALPQLYERHPAFLAVIPLMALLFYGGTFLTIVTNQEMTVLREEEAARFVERQQAEAIRTRLEERERLDMQICRMKHEMRGHMANIRGLSQSGSYDELEEYIARMGQGMEELDLTIRTGNAVTDVIINDKRRQCQEAGIAFRADFSYPVAGGYEAFDIGIILQNLLQNGLEAGEKAEKEKRFVMLTGKRKGKFFLIEVKNSCAGEVVFGLEGLPLTTKKKDVRLHGIGLTNVRRTAEKYMGELELKAEGQTFCATVLLQERSGYESFDAIRLRHGAVRLSGRSRDDGTDEGRADTDRGDEGKADRGGGEKERTGKNRTDRAKEEQFSRNDRTGQ